MPIIIAIIAGVGSLLFIFALEREKNTLSFVAVGLWLLAVTLMYIYLNYGGL